MATAPRAGTVACVSSLRISKLAALFGALLVLVACGARSGLELDPRGSGGAGGDEAPCADGETRACGSDVGACRQGLETCNDETFGPCEGALGPFEETCNGIDDDCDGAIDQPFGVGTACDGADNDQCADDVMSCAGCSRGDDTLETCNGIDDNCNGIVDADCEVGNCQPTLEVTGSTPSSPSCIDFPVQAESTGVIEYPCGGGPVTATLGGIAFTGSVSGGVVSLDGVAQVIGPDDCLWETTHHIGGTISSGTLSYTYHEHVIPTDAILCWKPCTETGVVEVSWVPKAR